MKILPHIFLLGLFLFLGAQCTVSPEQLLKTTATPTQTPITIGGKWEGINTHVRHMEYFFAKNENAIIILYEFDPAFFSFHFEISDTPKTIAQWGETFPNASLVINGVYFHEDYLPSGFLRAQNKRIGDRTFDPDRSGLLVLSPRVAIQDVNAKELKNIAFSDAAQSYPYLMKDGLVAVNEKTENVDRRTFFGTSREGKIYIGIVPHTAVSLYELSQILPKLPVVWDAVLNLDGGSSSGLIANIESFHETLPNYTAIPNVIVIEKKYDQKNGG